MNLDLLTKTIKSEKWWAYASMVHTLNSITEEFVSWAEGCACHGWLRQLRERRADGQRYSAEAMALQACRKHQGLPSSEGDGIHFKPCPLAGLRAMELATGAIDEFVDSLFDSYLPVMMEATSDLPQADMQQVLNDFTHGKASCMDHIAIKTQCWKVAPWSFAALAHPDEEVARGFSRKLVQDFDNAPANSALHHRKAWAHLSADGVGTRSEFDLFNAGTHSLVDLPRLRALVWGARFWPCVERVQEADHSLIHRGAISASKAGGPYVSMILRIPEVERLFDREAEYTAFLRDYSHVSISDNLAKRLGFWKHPLWCAAVEEKKRNRHKLQIAEAIMYSLDPISQFEGMAAVCKRRKQHQESRRKVEREWLKQFQARQVFSEAAVERVAMAEHLQARLVPGRLYSMPIASASLPSLQSSLQATKALRRRQPLQQLRLDVEAPDDPRSSGPLADGLVDEPGKHDDDDDSLFGDGPVRDEQPEQRVEEQDGQQNTNTHTHTHTHTHKHIHMRAYCICPGLCVA